MIARRCADLIKQFKLSEKIVVLQKFDNSLVKQILDSVESDPKHPKVLIVYDDQLANGLALAEQQTSSMSYSSVVVMRGFR